MLRKVLTGIAVFFLALAVGIAVFTWRMYQPELKVPARVIACTDIHKGCGNERFTVQFDQVPQVMQPFNMTLQLSPANTTKPGQALPETVHASFGMVGMEMGMNRYQLKQAGKLGWQAAITLPICMQGNSQWNLLLDLQSPKGIERYQLTFNARGSNVAQ